MDENTAPARANPGHAVGRLAEAFTAALTHEDPRVREAAEKRADAWRLVVAGMADGTLDIGSSTPVRHLPPWVTLEIAPGGFATGRAVAGGRLRPHEEDLARRHGLPATRSALYAHHLTQDGLAELSALLDSGAYEIDVPEQAALLGVAWLVRAGDTAGALRLLAAVEPFADTLCFTPRPAPFHELPGHVVHRASAGEVRADLDRRTRRRSPAENRPLVQQEALAVWNPFADRVLAHWWQTREGDRVDGRRPEGWRARGADLLAEYARLAAEHTLCTKHRRPKENLAVMLAALREAVESDGPTARSRGLLQHAVDSVVRKRGLPGSPAHSALRTAQAAHAARPTHDVLAGLVSARLAGLPQDSGVPRIEEALAPATREEADGLRVPVGWPVPAPLRRIALRAAAAPLDDLVALGVVPSAEVMAELVPALTASAEATAAPDPALSRLVAAHHRAFSRRRSLMLLNLESQVRAGRLPWVQALRPHLSDTGPRREAVSRLIPELGASALTHFPGTVLPNPLVREFNAVSRSAGLDLPWLEELAADIFTGEFAPKFLRAAKAAAALVEGTAYARYYDIDCAGVLALEEAPPAGSADRTSPFALLCAERAGLRGAGVASSGTVIEQAQILTTHNLATLVGAGAAPAAGWADLAWRAHALAVAAVERLPLVGTPRGHVRSAAFSWRQAVFFLSLCPVPEQREAVARMEESLPARPRHTRERMAPVVAGLRRVVDGGPLVEGGGDGARRFLGWSEEQHWMLEIAPQALLPRTRRWG
ncbi:transcriptional regulator [Nocardiopsis tropica]|uniref:Transcriptional regulator n=1 Tax=Nocardiopsis tropica TaxID=109330 RepID=A0ABU7L2M2_9ACTN|nr:transcriptional regulator [Nocardiopsis umidischolae]MEE2055167.1 transcriptional regulator [Nocardiopsis umidischolae]